MTRPAASSSFSSALIQMMEVEASSALSVWKASRLEMAWLASSVLKEHSPQCPEGSPSCLSLSSSPSSVSVFFFFLFVSFC